MSSFQFTKMHGLGNNYIYINMFKENLEENQLSELAIKVSNIHTGIGSDGMILICPSDKAPVKMRIFNNDGSEGKNCGNGLRCVAKYAYEHGIVTEKEFPIETLSGLVHAKLNVEDGQVRAITINMGAPRLSRSQIPMTGEEMNEIVAEPFELNEETHVITAVSMGNPHAVMFIDEIDAAPLTTVGPAMEKDQRFPESVNVEFVEVESSRELHFRVWERGSGITQACGTGACAAVVAAILNKKASKNEDVTVHLAGGDLIIRWEDDGDVYMTGPAEVICDGVFYY